LHALLGYAHGHLIHIVLTVPAFKVLRPGVTTMVRRMDQGDTGEEISERIREAQLRVRTALEGDFSAANYEVLDAQLTALYDLQQEFHDTPYANFHLPPPTPLPRKLSTY